MPDRESTDVADGRILGEDEDDEDEDGEDAAG